MKLDTSIVTGYLQGREEIAGHWLFTSIREGEHTFDRPAPARRVETEALLRQIEQVLADFTPCNAARFGALFPRWRELAAETNVLLAVGCPAPYDAMVREKDGTQYIIFDLIRFLDYRLKGEELVLLIRRLVTHELTHICLGADYPAAPADYRGKLGYITFNEGFAHALAYAEDLDRCDRAALAGHYPDARRALKKALAETDPRRQEENLQKCNAGRYWDKFAAISGKLYLLAHLEQMEAIYHAGPEAMLKAVLADG